LDRIDAKQLLLVSKPVAKDGAAVSEEVVHLCRIKSCAEATQLSEILSEVHVSSLLRAHDEIANSATTTPCEKPSHSPITDDPHHEAELPPQVEKSRAAVAFETDLDAVSRESTSDSGVASPSDEEMEDGVTIRVVGLRKSPYEPLVGWD
jgi:hypothetical protein